ncbi:SDR family oxidoreductase [Novosphingobium mangrovi (ex Huang et al. 2023)]|uniref:SDR family oxidoreductase n=1 Tax=Novosphingobium mangrovi (ex Huang et al. 2023) TaxID=2976432 RepID=A0ABT2I7M4_9SPHN|nr:SDR family oxidoreductase [Novosphingobium mangrovi (ex Huang et al. 2023)]MCT2400814.1 SDR family oxidoreductase [Novosphingobium mangrovi (ex Huang et al. 2023)]
MGKTIVITGAGAGMGKALAQRFAGEGETVILLGRTFSKVQSLADELGAPAMAVECDVANADSVRTAFAKIAEVHPRIDVLINNAAIYEPFTVAEATDKQIDSIIATNLNGPIYCCRAAIPMMEAGAQIINVGSESIAVPFVMLSLYQTSKAGLEMFSSALEAELEESGIRVTVVRAGPMFDEGKEAPNWDRDAAMRFHMGCAKNGLDLRTRPVSHSASVTGVFRAVLDLPPDVKLSHVTIGARKP